MKNSRGAYLLMKQLFNLANSAGVFRVNTSLQKQLDIGKIGSRRTFRYLEDNDYVIGLEGDRFQITDLAKINLLKEMIKKRKSDGKLRIVIFDIPETLKRNRNFFRRHLVELGFKMRQQSVWVSTLPCEDLIRLVARYHGLGKYVELIVGSVSAIS